MFEVISIKLDLNPSCWAKSKVNLRVDNLVRTFYNTRGHGLYLTKSIQCNLHKVSLTQTRIWSGYNHDESLCMHLLSPNFLQICPRPWWLSTFCINSLDAEFAKTNINSMFIGRRKMGIFLLMERLINLIKPYKDLSNFQSILYDRRRMTKIHLLTSVVIACQQSFYVGKLPRFNCLCSPI